MRRLILIVALIGVGAGTASIAVARPARQVSCHARYTYRFRATRVSCATARRVVSSWVHSQRRCGIGDSPPYPRRRRCTVRHYRCRARLATLPDPIGGEGAAVTCTRRRSRIAFDRPV